MKNNRQTQRTARAASAVAMAAALALTVTACGGRSDETTTAKPATTGAGTPAAPSTGATTGPNPAQVLATIKGPQGIVITLTSAARETGGFVTVQGTVHNTGTHPYTGATYWVGDEAALQKNGGSLAGASLVDMAGKKRYYVLRDTDGNCLCTVKLDIIEPGATVPIFAQFPAPPATTTQVDFDLPTMPTASIVISQ
ncbi:hypothetical protein POF50_011940 [Streptomyces sp. SL13]|jgi:hypothetical protein|uniref:DUF4352 domain-containing protein n=1 Tax=Streptantibioticus silvisoli TaxID=2705255 RepID=A0AA90H8T4_9ACTN|nr:hypothetical protein [Streptantibioticus silvisoli]MDI5963995.1 hypothetical protein [Streptantibioticus silvisoli]MDI5970042.1 hypothetical protein [Streptantibioticus silvisoli]